MNIVWIDVESTGLIAHKEHLLEIACLVTDEDLNILDEKGYHAIVQYRDPFGAKTLRNAAVPFVQDMHDKTRLWDKLRRGTPLNKIDADLAKYLRQFGRTGQMPVGGNTVRLDMNFMDEHLPRVAKHLDYHMRDVTSLAGFMNDWFDIPWLEKKSDHTAMIDVRESIREAKFYRNLLRLKGFGSPGVTVEQLEYVHRLGEILENNEGAK